MQWARSALRQQPQAVVVGRRAPELEARPVENESTEVEQRPGIGIEPRRARPAPAAPWALRRKRQLLPRHLVPRRRPGGVVAEKEPEGHEALAVPCRARHLDLEPIA